MTATAPQGWRSHGLCGAPEPSALPCCPDSGESACDAGGLGLIPRSEGPLEKDSPDRGAWWATAHGATESQARLSD